MPLSILTRRKVLAAGSAGLIVGTNALSVPARAAGLAPTKSMRGDLTITGLMLRSSTELETGASG